MGMYKTCAVLGTVVMGICSFMACSSGGGSIVAIGNAGLLASIAIMSYGFSKWQP